MKRLGGWQRLWVLVGAVYLAVVVAIAWTTLPDAASVPHNASFYSRLPSEIQEHILNTKVDATKERAFIKEAKGIPDVDTVEMPNGHILIFRKDLSRTVGDRVADLHLQTAAANAYWGEVENYLPRKRISHLMLALMWWLLPMVLLYVLGWSFGWVYRGFKEHRSA